MKMQKINHNGASYRRDMETGRVMEIHTALDPVDVRPGQLQAVRLDVRKYANGSEATGVTVWTEQGEQLCALSVYAYNDAGGYAADYTAELIQRHPLGFYVKHWGGQQWIVDQLQTQGVIIPLTDERRIAQGCVEGVRAYRLRFDGWAERFNWGQVDEIEAWLHEYGGDGHSLLAPECLARFPIELRERFTKVHESQMGDPKATIYKDGKAVAKLEGVWSLTVHIAMCQDLNVPAPSMMGRGFQAKACASVLKGAMEQRRVNAKAERAPEEDQTEYEATMNQALRGAEL